MKKMLIILLLIITVSTFTFGQKTKDEARLMSIEPELVDSIVVRKLSVIEKYYANNCVFITPDGIIIAKMIYSRPFSQAC